MSNLLPQPEIKKITLLYRKRFLIVAFRAVMALAVISMVFLFPSYIYSKNEQISLLAQKNILNSMETSELKQNLISNINDINNKLNAFKAGQPKSPVVASFIDPILKARISSVHLSSLSYNLVSNTQTAQVQIAGIADNREAILNFADNLKQQPEIKNVNVPIGNFIKDSNMDFSISLLVLLK